MNKTFTLLLFLLCVTSCNAQSPQILHGNLENLSFVGYYNGHPVFYTISDEYGLFKITRLGRDSLNIERFRNSRFSVWSDNIRLIWVNDDIEIYTRRQPYGGNNKDFIIVTKSSVDTVSVTLNWFYDRGYEPFAITSDRKTLFAVQPSGRSMNEPGGPFENIMKIDLTKRPLVVEKLPIEGITIHIDGDFLYYKGGCGSLHSAILRVEIGNWDKIDTLTMYTDFWFVYDNVLFAEIMRYSTIDEWFGGNRFIAFCLSERASAIVSRERPRHSDWFPILFEDKYYNPFAGGLYKIPIPKITEFPHRQALPANR